MVYFCIDTSNTYSFDKIVFLPYCLLYIMLLFYHKL